MYQLPLWKFLDGILFFQSIPYDFLMKRGWLTILVYLRDWRRLSLQKLGEVMVKPVWVGQSRMRTLYLTRMSSVHPTNLVYISQLEIHRFFFKYYYWQVVFEERDTNQCFHSKGHLLESSSWDLVLKWCYISDYPIHHHLELFILWNYMFKPLSCLTNG